MTKCKYCEQEMLEADGCDNSLKIEFPGGILKNPIPYEDEEGLRCHDCNAKPGFYHHPGCDMEICPICKGQLITCDCSKD
jgi:hypothetical protein